jgi:hypothetical protein
MVTKIKKLSFMNETKLLYISFLIVLIFFLLQHYWFLGWDFAVYVINSKFLFNQGGYMEMLRAPLASVLLVGSVFIGKLGEYIYIILVAIMFFIGNLKLSGVLYEKYFHKYGLNKTQIRFLFFIFSLTPFVLSYGLVEGTELLGLGFFEIFLFYFISNRNSGHFLGLAALSRYNFLAFFPLLFINKDYKKILKNVFLFLIVLLPWLIYNRLHWGNFLASIVESYSHNIIDRQGIMKAFNFLHLFYSINFLIVFFTCGIIFLVFNIFKKNRDRDPYIIHSLFLLIFLVFIADYNNTPLKIMRYLFNLSLPIAYFSLIGFLVLIRRFSVDTKKQLLFLVFVFWFIIISWLFYSNYTHRSWDDVYGTAAIDIRAHGLQNCSIRSNHWIHIRYYVSSGYSLWDSAGNVMDKGEILLVFYDDVYSQDKIWLKGLNYSVISENDQYILASSKGINSENCLKEFYYSYPDFGNFCGVIATRFTKIGLENSIKKICLLFNKV